MKEVRIGEEPIGPVPLVVGTVSRAETLEAMARAALKAHCDIVEVRLDLVGAEDPAPLTLLKALSALKPVLLTIRGQAQGGAWSGAEEARLALYRQALPWVAAVDIESASAGAPELVKAADDADVVCLLSHHDFKGTPDEKTLLEWVRTMGAQGAHLAKVATRTDDAASLARLASVLEPSWAFPVCLLGMGELGERSRIELPLRGSCLTYGYLDESAAPGQWPADKLVEELVRVLPAYAARQQS